MRRAREGTQGSNPCLSANSPSLPVSICRNIRSIPKGKLLGVLQIVACRRSIAQL